MNELDYIKAFRTLLEKSLAVDKSKAITVLYDEDFFKYFKYLSKFTKTFLPSIIPFTIESRFLVRRIISALLFAISDASVLL